MGVQMDTTRDSQTVDKRVSWWTEKWVRQSVEELDNRSVLKMAENLDCSWGYQRVVAMGVRMDQRMAAQLAIPWAWSEHQWDALKAPVWDC